MSAHIDLRGREHASPFLKDIRDGLEYAPPYRDSGIDLRGWILKECTLCKECSSRLTMRGLGTYLRGATPVWSGDERVMDSCYGCGVRP